MQQPIKLQFAFQGGGAKLIALLAAAEVIQKFERNGTIKVTRTAGTSAGAIAAALVAGGISADNVLSQLQGGQGDRLVKPYSMPGWIRIYYRLRHQKASLWDSGPLRQWLDKIFEKEQLRRISDFKGKRDVSLVVTKTDLGSRATVTARDEDVIADALVDSCGLPYLFKIWNNRDSSTFVDGGISNNLPVKFLAGASVADGEMIAVCFADKSTSHPSNVSEFSLALLESAMASTMALTREAFRGQLLEIDTSIGTLDFAAALSEKFTPEYNSIKKKLEEDLQKHIDRIRQANRISVTNPWKETNPTAVSLMKDVGRLHTELSKGLITYDSCRMTVYSNGGRPPGDQFANARDKLKFELQIRTEDQPLYSLSVGLVRQSIDSEFANETATCHVRGPDGEKPKFLKLAMKTEDADAGDRELCLFFTPPLPANSGPYMVSFEEDGAGLMADLFLIRKDYLGYRPQRTNRPVGIMEFVLYVHRDVRVVFGDAEGDVKYERMDKRLLQSTTELYPDMCAYGVVSKNVAGAWVVPVHRVD